MRSIILSFLTIVSFWACQNDRPVSQAQTPTATQVEENSESQNAIINQDDPPQKISESESFIRLQNDADIDPEIIKALTKQTKDQIYYFLNADMEEMDKYGPTYEEYKEHYPKFFLMQHLMVQFPFFERFFDQNQWVLPRDEKAFFDQFVISTSRAPFLQMRSQVLTYFREKFNDENYKYHDFIITKSPIHPELYNLTAIMKGPGDRLYAFRNHSCYYLEDRGCLTYLSWKYLGRLNSDLSGNLWTNADSWANHKNEK